MAGWQQAALVMAGVIGSAGAIFHGVVIERRLVGPLREISASILAPPLHRLVRPLLHFSTFNWLIGGLALILAAFLLEAQARCAVSLLVGSSYVFAAVGNLYATRSVHPGWILMVTALLLMTAAVRA